MSNEFEAKNLSIAVMSQIATTIIAPMIEALGPTFGEVPITDACARGAIEAAISAYASGEGDNAPTYRTDRAAFLRMCGEVFDDFLPTIREAHHNMKRKLD